MRCQNRVQSTHHADAHALRTAQHLGLGHDKLVSGSSQLFGCAYTAQGGGGTITELLRPRGVLGQLSASSWASRRNASRNPSASPTCSQACSQPNGKTALGEWSGTEQVVV